MTLESCNFLTPRLIVREWHVEPDSEWSPPELTDVVAGILTSAVTHWLPEAWRGDYDAGRAAAWIDERDREGPTLLVIDRATQEAVGLIILFESSQESPGVEVRLGYLLAESAWGRGYATELIRGFVDWCRPAGVASIIGGVGQGNLPSRRVLEKNGFVCVPGTEGAAEQMFQLQLRE